MVLESLISPLKAEKKPWDMLFHGFLYNTIAIFLALWIFEQYASLVMVFLTVIACVPLMYSTIKIEEKKDITIYSEKTLLKEHAKALSFFMYLFLGIMLSVSLWYVILPTSIHHALFSIQTETIEAINYQITGNVTQEVSIFLKIFLNNMRVLVFCLLFAFIYGAGAIFILTWNASVIGVAIGNFIRSNIGKYSTYFHIVPLAVLRYMTHGLFEIGAYFMVGLAGGIISIAVIRHDFGTKRFEHILLDSVDLIILSIVFLLIAAITEVYITPALF
ncbi:MAG: stage II sporulation protein M [Nanoarchaeota archaeon]|nr:stage II sporulation protein M [Nanoarchaeota archaeon]